MKDRISRERKSHPLCEVKVKEAVSLKISRIFAKRFFPYFSFSVIGYRPRGHFCFRNVPPKHELSRSKRIAKFSNRLFELHRPCSSVDKLNTKEVLSGYFEQEISYNSVNTPKAMPTNHFLLE